MPISEQLFKAEENRSIKLDRATTVGEALGRLLEPGAELEPWWFAILRRGDGTWLAVRLERLAKLLEEDPELLGRPIAELAQLGKTEVVERDALGTGEARRYARRAPGRVVVVTDGGRFVGVVSAGFTRGGVLEKQTLRRLLRDTPAMVPAPETRYTDIGCPEKVSLTTPRFQITVRLTLEPVNESAAERAFKAIPGQTVTVELDAPDFEVLKPRRQDIEVLAHRDSPPVVFDLRPLEIGNFPLALRFFQGTHLLGAASFSVEVLADQIAEVQTEKVRSRIEMIDSAAQPCLLMRIGLARGGDLLELHVSDADSGLSRRLVGPFHGEHEDHIRKLYKNLSQKQDERTLQEVGWALWDLLPVQFRNLYSRERDRWRGRELLLYADEPNLPWELVWPYDPDWQDQENEPWCLSHCFSRWLDLGEHCRWVFGPRRELELKAAACIAPRSSDLPLAQEEQRQVRERIRRHHLRDLSPSGADERDLLVLLEELSCDWLHLAAHGRHDDRSADQSSAVSLEDYRLFTPSRLRGPLLMQRLERDRPGFFFNVCHGGRLGTDLHGLAGWAPRLIECGAGAFLAPAWPVPDAPALEFATNFYDRILGREALALGEAVRQARRVLLEKGDPTWFAYVLYGHPNAKVRLPGRSQEG